jgi:hypothetical protein
VKPLPKNWYFDRGGEIAIVVICAIH